MSSIKNKYGIILAAFYNLAAKSNNWTFLLFKIIKNLKNNLIIRLLTGILKENQLYSFHFVPFIIIIIILKVNKIGLLIEKLKRLCQKTSIEK